MSLNAAEALYGADPEKAMEKVALARGLVHEGLDTIRQAVRMIEYNGEDVAGSEIISALIRISFSHLSLFGRNAQKLSRFCASLIMKGFKLRFVLALTSNISVPFTPLD